MIEINLVPDVKQELIRAQRTRSLVITTALIAGAGAVAVTVLLGVWVFGAQTARSYFADKSITEESTKLAAVDDIESSLTIQNQLGVLPSIHEKKHMGSRVFDVLATIAPLNSSEVSISKVMVNAEDKRITLEAQAPGGFLVLEAFKKTILATKFQYTESDGAEEQEVPLTQAISDGERSYGQDSSGNRVLRFTLSFNYPEELFKPYLKDAKIAGPTVVTNVTDSHLGIPQTLFSSKASDEAKEGGN